MHLLLRLVTLHISIFLRGTPQEALLSLAMWSTTDYAPPREGGRQRVRGFKVSSTGKDSSAERWQSRGFLEEDGASGMDLAAGDGYLGGEKQVHKGFYNNFGDIVREWNGRG